MSFRAEPSRYVFELFPTRDDGRGSCASACGHCLYADRDLDGGSLTYSPDVLRYFDELQKVALRENALYALGLSGLVTRLSSVPRTNEACAEIGIPIGDMTAFDAVPSVEAAAMLFRKASQNDEARRRTNQTFRVTDESLQFPTNPKLALAKLDDLLRAYAGNITEFSGMGFPPVIGLSIDENAVDPGRASFLKDAHPVLQGALHALARRYSEGFESLHDVDVGASVNGHSYSVNGGWIVTAGVTPFVQQGDPEDRRNFKPIAELRYRYIAHDSAGRAPEGGTFAGNISLHADRVLIGHSTFSVNLDHRWISYGDLGAFITKAQEAGRPLQSVIETELDLARTEPPA